MPRVYLGLPDVALESIAFQNPILFKELTQIFADLRKVPRAELAESPLLASMSVVIKHHQNMRCAVELDPQGPCAYVPAADKNHPLLIDVYRQRASDTDALALIRESKGVIKGSINSASGRVSGVFANLLLKIGLPESVMIGDFYTPEESAAILLHEIGHLTSYFEYISRSVTTNQVLAGLHQGLANTQSITERTVLITTASNALRLKNVDIEGLAKASSNQIIETVVLTKTIEQSRSELGANLYDSTSWEYLSDQFATRHGAGRHLVSALNKLYRAHGNISFRSTPAYLVLETLKVLRLVAMPLLPAVLWPFILMTQALFYTMDGTGDNNYDTPEARFQRVRNQIIENLKDRELDKDSVLALKADLEYIDSIMKAVNDRRQWVGVFLDAVVPKYRKGRDQMLLQQDLEKLAANDLFAKAATFQLT